MHKTIMLRSALRYGLRIKQVGDDLRHSDELVISHQSFQSEGLIGTAGGETMGRWKPNNEQLFGFL